MLWSAFFLVGILQGLFLISLLIFRKSDNGLASRLMIAMIVPMIISNTGYLIIRTEAVRYVPQMYGLSFGTLFLFGPLIYLYCRSIIDPEFRWDSRQWLHFTPYGIQLVLNLPFLMQDRQNWIGFINDFMAGILPVPSFAVISFIAQDIHLLTYLLVTARRVRLQRQKSTIVHYLVPFAPRIRWVMSLGYAFALLLAVVLAFLIHVVVRGTYDPVTNYVYTLATTGLVYFVAFRFMLSPHVISPDFTQKYGAYRQLSAEEGREYQQKLTTLFEREKIFTDPEFKLPVLAEALGLPPHLVSKLIHERFGKSFTDLVNEYRVREFVTRAGSGDYGSHSILGIAFDVGFSSKSAFNSAFKKITGKTPSQFRKDTDRRPIL